MVIGRCVAEGNRMGWKVYDEAVEMLERQFQYLPRCFRWRGHRFRVEAVTAVWVRRERPWHRQGGRRFFRVRCAEGDLELYQDLRTGAWFLRRARLLPIKAARAGSRWPTWPYVLGQEVGPGAGWTALVR